MIPKSGVVHNQSAVIPSDRMGMMMAANHFISLMVEKQTSPEVLDLTEEEERTYNKALDYLDRQFSLGHSDNETVPVAQYQDYKY